MLQPFLAINFMINQTENTSAIFLFLFSYSQSFSEGWKGIRQKNSYFESENYLTDVFGIKDVVCLLTLESVNK